jgi:hypothetical protein
MDAAGSPTRQKLRESWALATHAAASKAAASKAEARARVLAELRVGGGSNSVQELVAAIASPDSSPVRAARPGRGLAGLAARTDELSGDSSRPGCGTPSHDERHDRAREMDELENLRVASTTREEIETSCASPMRHEPELQPQPQPQPERHGLDAVPTETQLGEGTDERRRAFLNTTTVLASPVMSSKQQQGEDSTAAQDAELGEAKIREARVPPPPSPGIHERSARRSSFLRSELANSALYSAEKFIAAPTLSSLDELQQSPLRALCLDDSGSDDEESPVLVPEAVLQRKATRAEKCEHTTQSSSTS